MNLTVGYKKSLELTSQQRIHLLGDESGDQLTDQTVSLWEVQRPPVNSVVKILNMLIAN